MRTVAEIDKEIARLKQQMETVEGTPTEIYTRIVGYYRSVKNWNKGKREEYTFRKLFQPPEGRMNGEDRVDGENRSAGKNRRNGASADATFSSGPKEEEVSEVDSEAAGADVQEAVVSTGPAEYLYFYRRTCPNCPAVKNYLQETELTGEAVDVDTDAGIEKAREYGVMSTPTVIFFDDTDDNDRELFRAYDVEGIKKILNEERADSRRYESSRVASPVS